MLKCPVCKNSYKQEVSICQRCNLLEQDIDRVNQISPDHPILTTCIPSLIKTLEKYRETNQKNETRLNLQKLKTKVQVIYTKQEQSYLKIEELESIVNDLKSQIQRRNSYRNNDSNVSKEQVNSIQTQSQIPIKNTFTYPVNLDISNMKVYSKDYALSEPSSFQINSFSNWEYSSNNNDLVNTQDDCQNNSNSELLFGQQESELDNETGKQNFAEVDRDRIPQFVEAYNLNKNLFDRHAVSIVIETQESMENRLAGRGEAVYLSDNTKGKYWIIEEDNNYYLVPHAKIKINEHNKHTIENLFEYDESNSDNYDFKLIEPAKVFKTNLDLWQLEKKGKLEFC